MHHYEEVKLSEMSFEGDILQFPCPCGDLFEMTVASLLEGNDYAECPTCSLTVKVLYTDEERDAYLAKHNATKQDPPADAPVSA